LKGKSLYIFIAGSAILFGTMEVALKTVSTSLDPFQVTFLRFLFGGIVLLPFAINEYRSKPKGFMTKRLWLTQVFLGGAVLPSSMTLYQFAVMGANASTVAIIFCTNPVFTMLIAHLMTEDEKLNRLKILALALGAVGLVLLIHPWEIQEGNTLAGALLSLATSAVFGLYNVISGKNINRVGAYTQVSSNFLIGSLVLFCLLQFLGRPVFEGVGDHLGVVLYVSAAVTGGGYLLYFFAMKRSNATTASTVFFLKPVIAPIFAVILLGEVITYNMYIGIALVLTASYILIFRKNK